MWRNRWSTWDDRFYIMPALSSFNSRNRLQFFRNFVATNRSDRPSFERKYSLARANGFNSPHRELNFNAGDFVPANNRWLYRSIRHLVLMKLSATLAKRQQTVLDVIMLEELELTVVLMNDLSVAKFLSGWNACKWNVFLACILSRYANSYLLRATQIWSLFAMLQRVCESVKRYENCIFVRQFSNAQIKKWLRKEQLFIGLLQQWGNRRSFVSLDLLAPY